MTVLSEGCRRSGNSIRETMMESSTMGRRVIVPARIENANDLMLVDNGTLSPDKVRRVDVSDALVDTGATFLSLPGRLIRELGLKRYRTRRLGHAAASLTSGCTG